MNGPQVPDTSVFILAIRGDDTLQQLTRAVRSGRGYLSSVVAANARHMEQWARMARRAGRQVWVQAV